MIGIFLLLAASLRASAAPLPLGIPKIEGAQADAEVAFDTRTFVFHYEYRLGNSTASVGAIDAFAVDVTTTGAVALSTDNLKNSATGYSETISAESRNDLDGDVLPIGLTSSPPGWRVALDNDGAASWIKGGKGSQTIAPGKNQRGFAFDSPGFPGIREFQASAFFNPSSYFKPGPNEADEPDKAAELEKQIEEASKLAEFHGMTVGPKSPPSVDAAGEFIDYILEEAKEAQSLGWISDADALRRVEASLTTAKNAISAKKMDDAKTILSSVTWDRKQMNANAIALLKSNVDFILFKFFRTAGLSPSR